MVGCAHSRYYSENRRNRTARPEIRICTNAAAGKLGTSPDILAAAVIEPGIQASDGYCPTALTEKTDPVWGAIFPTTDYICGLELLAVAEAVSSLRDFARGKNVISTRTTPTLSTP